MSPTSSSNASESTSLLRAQAELEAAASAMSSFAGEVFTKENLHAAGKMAKDQAVQLKQQAQEGTLSYRVVAILGGLLLVAIASFNVLGDLLTFNVSGALIQIYSILVGILIFILESSSNAILAPYVDRIHKFALFLKYLWGRGCLYFIIGTLQVSQRGFFSTIVGVFLCVLGIGFIILGNRTGMKLKEMRKNIYSESELLAQFKRVDSDNDGFIALNEFGILCKSLGLDINRRETEAAFLHLAKSTSQKLSYKEFQTWWNDADADRGLDDNALLFV